MSMINSWFQDYRVFRETLLLKPYRLHEFVQAILKIWVEHLAAPVSIWLEAVGRIEGNVGRFAGVLRKNHSSVTSGVSSVEVFTVELY